MFFFLPCLFYENSQRERAARKYSSFNSESYVPSCVFLSAETLYLLPAEALKLKNRQQRAEKRENQSKSVFCLNLLLCFLTKWSMLHIREAVQTFVTRPSNPESMQLPCPPEHFTLKMHPVHHSMESDLCLVLQRMKSYRLVSAGPAVHVTNRHVCFDKSRH